MGIEIKIEQSTLLLPCSFSLMNYSEYLRHGNIFELLLSFEAYPSVAVKYI